MMSIENEPYWWSAMKLSLVVALLLAACLHASAQSVTLFDVDASNFPMMKAKYIAVDASAVRQNPPVADLRLRENWLPRTITSAGCPPLGPGIPISAVLTTDISFSMEQSTGVATRLQMAQSAAHVWVDACCNGTNECAITSFNQFSYVNHDFTTVAVPLHGAVDGLQLGAGTSYDDALLEPPAGALYVAQRAKYQRVVVFVTDGEQKNLKMAEIIAEAQRQNCRVYAVVIGMPCPESLREIARATGGMWFDNVYEVEQMKGAYITILNMARGLAPCEIQWHNSNECSPEDVTVELAWMDAFDQGNYTISGGDVGEAVFTPSMVHCASKPVGVRFDTTITLTARNKAFTATNITSINPAFTISPTSVTLAEGRSQTFVISYTPADSGYTWTEFTFVTAGCPVAYVATGGYPGVKPKADPLRLTVPNGGEEFVVGSDTAITWAGISPGDTVTLEYSIDGGSTWKMITDRATGHRYVWKNIPRPTSTRCLVRIRQQQITAGGSTSLVLPHGSGGQPCIAWSPIGERVVTGGFDAKLRIWNSMTGTELRSITTAHGNVLAVDWSPDGQLLASGGTDDRTAVWNLASGARTSDILWPDGDILSMAFSPHGDSLAAGTAQGVVRFWNIHATTLQGYFKGLSYGASSLSWRFDGQRFLAAGNDGNSAIFDVSTWKLIGSGVLWANWAAAVDFSPTGDRMLFTGGSDMAFVEDAVTRKRLYELVGHTSDVICVDWSPDGSMIATGSLDNTVRIWDARTGAQLRTLVGHAGWVRSVRWGPNSRRVASTSMDNTARIWDVDVAYLQEDVSDMVFAIVQPALRSTDIDMGRVLVAGTKDSVVTSVVENTGKYPVRIDSVRIAGADAGQFGIVATSVPAVLAVGARHGMEFRFVPASVGVKSAQLLVYVQGDTLRRTIRGEGVLPQLDVVHTLIDFGQVAVGQPKDTLQVVTVKNTGPTPLSVVASRHASPNAVDFSTLAGGAPFTIPPGKEVRMDLRFLPGAQGRTSGRLLFDYAGVGSPATIVLYGEGVLKGAMIRGTVPQYPPLACVAEAVDSIYVENTGNADLLVSDAVIGGTDAADFSFVVPFVPLQVLPGGRRGLAVRFAPQATGIRTALVTLRSNSDSDDPLVLPLTGEMNGSGYSVSHDTINLGTLCPGETADTSVTVTMLGTVMNVVDVSVQGVQASMARLEQAAGTLQVLGITWPGTAPLGAIHASVILVDSICSTVTVVHVVGQVELTDVEADDLALAAFTTAAVERDLTVRNNSGRAVTMATLPDITPFTFVGVTLPVEIPAHGTLGLRVRYTPVANTSPEVVANFGGTPCDAAFAATISGRRTPVTLRIGNVEGYAGQNVGVPVYLDGAGFLAGTGATGITARLRYNVSLLEPYGALSTGVVALRLPVGTDGTGGTAPLASLPFRAALGTDSVTVLAVEDVTVEGSDAVIGIEDGRFRLLDICMQGGARLVNGNGQLAMAIVYPNPTYNGFMTVAMETIEAGYTTLVLHNVQGQALHSYLNGNVDAGRTNVTMDVRGLAPGLYFLALHTPTVQRTLRIEILR